MENNVSTTTVRELEKLRERLAGLKECFRVSSLVSSSLELDQVLENIMSASRSIFKAESCSLMLVDDSSGDLVFEVAQGPVAHMLQKEMRLKKGQGIAGRVYETGEPLLIEDAYSDSRFDPDFDRMTGYRTRSILCVPLVVKDRVIGISQMINKVDGGRFTADDRENFGLLCINAAVAVENARLHRRILNSRQIEQDLAFASKVQLSFLPREMPQVKGFRFAAHYRAAREVGGDFYDFIPLSDERLGVLIGDVSGKGIASALFMARLTSDFRLLAIREKDPGALIGRVNGMVCGQSCMGMFATLQYLVFGVGLSEFTYVNAGHLPPVIWNRVKGEFTLLDGGGPPVGVLCGQRYETSVTPLSPGDCILLATDGLVEARNAKNELFGWHRLEEAVRSGDPDVESVKSRIISAIEGFVEDRPQSDDTTIVVIGVEEG